MKVPRLNMLFSYPYVRRKVGGRADWLGECCAVSDVMLDSGAFTNYKAAKMAAARGLEHKPVTLDDYIGFLRLYGHEFWGYVALDVIRETGATAANFGRMVDAGLRPMGVLTGSQSVEEANDYVSVNPRMCVAGAADSFMQLQALHRYGKVYKATGGKAQIHALGLNTYPEMIQVPIASCDATTLMAGGQYGQARLFYPHRRAVTFSKLSQSYATLPAVDRSAIQAVTCATNDDWHDPASWIGTTCTIAAVANAMSVVRQWRFVHDRGVRLFFALVGSNLRLLLAVLQASSKYDFDRADWRETGHWFSKIKFPDAAPMIRDLTDMDDAVDESNNPHLRGTE